MYALHPQQGLSIMTMGDDIMNEKNMILEAINQLLDPSTEKPLGITQSVKFIAIDEEESLVNLIIGVKEITDKIKQTLTRQIAKIVKIDHGYKGVKIEFELLAKTDSILDKKRKIQYIGVASGKGGVGKSTVAVNLAIALNRIGKQVALIDADIYGSSVPVLMDIKPQLPRTDENEKIIPFSKHNIEVISTEFFLKDNQPLMWRGPMLGKMLNHFFYDVIWDANTEYIVVDLPPGTGDVAIDIQKLIPECQMLIVTTPHPSASHVAVKAGFAAKQLNHHILGVIENMSYLIHNEETLPIFGEGGGNTVASKLNTECIATIPIGQPENNHPGIYGMNETIGVHYLGLANKVVKALS